MRGQARSRVGHAVIRGEVVDGRAVEMSDGSFGIITGASLAGYHVKVRTAEGRWRTVRVSSVDFRLLRSGH